ncbi:MULTISPECIES: aminoglycoside phosphotransferase family protein [unclassified Streptomyces]|uniref:aminoglycoside phosphotransferase family protein n=1 Tax=unclassified Streptomyces TaxID=2593676 RepID=UPI0006FBB582|nr:MULTISPECIES: aminoglycoside phosphotransferase family protein [unclassified Streptomyces]KQX59514.1 hydroxyurea phosphotransferase [Streptomyces sp. Root1304]KRB00771.1 hydroxyurea phosphotransferase [Streptomyces sp. Root66D1]
MIHVPEELARSQVKYNGEAGRAFVAGLPALAEDFLGRWGLRVTGPSMHGVASLVLPVERAADGAPAALKMQILDDETEGEPAGLLAWGGDGCVRLLDHDPATGTMLLERLDEARPLTSHADTREALGVVAGLLARLSAVPAPAGLRGLGDITAAMLDAVPGAEKSLGAADAAVLRDCAAAVREVAGEPGDRLLHWDLHLGNVLAADREPWLAIDPKPLAGDPGFELLPALMDRFDPDPAEVLWRFDLLAEVVGDRGRAVAWTLGRVLQNGLWDVEDGEPALDPEQVAAARILLAGRA